MVWSFSLDSWDELKINDYFHNSFEHDHAFHGSNSPSGLRLKTQKGMIISFSPSSIQYVIHSILEYNPYNPLLRHDIRLHQRKTILTKKKSVKNSILMILFISQLIYSYDTSVLKKLLKNNASCPNINTQSLLIWLTRHPMPLIYNLWMWSSIN